MDSFFKAAVCDLDKLLDDFELNTDEHECKSVFLKPSVFPFNPLGSQCLPPEPPAVPPNLPDLNALHYGSASSGNDSSPDDREVKGQPLTAVDLLSSVDHGPARSSAPACPDRALKPVCDLVNDTGSAVLARADSHDAFGELDVAEKQMEEESLLVDFDGPVVTAHREDGEEKGTSVGNDEPPGEFSASLSLLDVILPAVAERSCEPAGDSLMLRAAESPGVEEREFCVDSLERLDTLPVDGAGDTSEEEEASDGGEVESPAALKSGVSGELTSLSHPPSAASVCGALVDSGAPEDESGPAANSEATESTESDFLLASEVREDPSHLGGCADPPASQQAAEGRASPEGCLPPGPAPSSEHSPIDLPEFGFEFLPESDQAELLVTDEELDAFLQAHTEGGRGSGASHTARSQPESPSESDGGPENRAVDPELRSCSAEDELEGLARPESDRTMCVSAEGCPDPGAPSPPRDSYRPHQEEPQLSSTSSSSPSQHIGSPDQQPCCGGARPKQLHCQTARPPPAGGEGAEPDQTLSEEPNAAEPEEVSCPAEEHSHAEDERPFEEQQESSVGPDELSEPPPYPGEPPSEGAEPDSWRREAGEELGSRQPAWVPDSEAPNCMNCYQRFTFTRRRHHCRACGKVYCAMCCYRRCKLRYLEKEARVCVVCFDAINRAQALERMMSPAGPSPNPNIPSEYCSTIPPLQQARAAGTLNSPPPTVMVPVSVLKHPNSEGCPREQKRVWFADGILPNGEVADTTKLSVSRRSSQEFSSVSPDQTTPDSTESDAGVDGGGGSSSEVPDAVEAVRPPVAGPWDYALLAGVGSLVRRVPSLLPDNEDELPPLLIATGEDRAGEVLIEESPAPCQILHLLEEGGPLPLAFVLNPNLLVNVKLVTYSGRQCWCFGSNGLQALGQRELVFVLECLPEEKALPKDLFSLYLNIYQEAQKGKFLDELDNLTFTSTFLGSKDHAGMLFVPPTCQPLDGLTLPPRPFLFGLLIQKLEVPWAKVFPLRLLLRLGAEYDVYPTPLTSVRFRESVYRETGHTIMNLLADLRNYQYSLSVVEGLRIHMEMGHSYIDIPKSSFNEMQKVVNASNEHVISIGARLSPEADSHLVCFQNQDGNYRTQASSVPGKTRTVTGASFVVFNGALKASSGFIAKSSIVEDGLMVQIPPETMESLRTALREQTDFNIPCGRIDGGEVRENVTVRWVDWSSPVNAGRTSGVDGRPLDGIHSVRVLQEAEFEADGRTIRCTEVFYQLRTADRSLALVLASCGVFQKEMALAACGALTPHLAALAASGINALTLRVSTQADMVEYQAGSGGRLLPQRYMNELDGALIPVIHGGGTGMPQTAMDVEFVFYITHAI